MRASSAKTGAGVGAIVSTSACVNTGAGAGAVTGATDGHGQEPSRFQLTCATAG